MTSVVFRVFKAIDEPDLCLKFIEGHRRVLEIYGITMITSNKALWTNHENTYIIIVESKKDGKIVGGARIQIADNNLSLPIVEAVGSIDNKIFSVVDEYNKNNLTELCGLWNSREVAGYGIGSTFLIRTGIALAKVLNIRTILALCAPATVKMCSNSGFVIEKSLGKDGYFNYPKLDLIATAMIVKDIRDLSNATPESQEFVESLYNLRIMNKIEKGVKGEIAVEYNLNLSY